MDFDPGPKGSRGYQAAHRPKNWVDFPNYLKQSYQEEVFLEADQAPLKETQVKSGSSLSFEQEYTSFGAKQEDQDYQPAFFDSFKDKAQERGQAKARREVHEDLAQRKTRLPFVPSQIPKPGLTFQPKEKPALIAYDKLEEALRPNPDDLMIFLSQEEPLVDLGPQVDLAEKNSPDSPNHQAGRSSYQPAFTKKKNKNKQVQEETLLQEIPDSRSMEPLAPLTPLPGKQRRAMNRSLSWIMEQEQGQEKLPYSSETEDTHE